MMSKRMPLALTLGAVLFVTAGFGATKKVPSQRRIQRLERFVASEWPPAQREQWSIPRQFWLPFEWCVADFRLVSHPWQSQHP